MAEDSKENQTCIVCQAPLTGAQTRFCSSKCTSKWHRTRYPERQREAQRKWREKNREKVNDYVREYRNRNSEKARASKRKYYQKNREKIIRQTAEYKKEYLQRPEVKERIRKQDIKARFRKKNKQGLLHKCRGVSATGQRCKIELRGSEEFCRWHKHQQKKGHFFDREARRQKALVRCRHLIDGQRRCGRMVSKDQVYCWQHQEGQKRGTYKREYYCLICGSPLRKWRSKYCSDECYRTAVNQRKNDPRIKGYVRDYKEEQRRRKGQGKTRLLRCAICGKKLQGKQTKYCSEQCKMKRHLIGN